MDLRLLRQIVQALLQEASPDGSLDLGIYVVAEAEMTRLNETFLHHKGSTDVITFDYAERVPQAPPLFRQGVRAAGGLERQGAYPALLHGEIFVCLDEAVSQASRFHVSWQSEVVRYIVHGVLHLLGYDDLSSRARRRMKAAEDALVGQLARRFDFRRLSPVNG